MGAPENLTANASKVAYTNYWVTDQVLRAETVTYTVAAGSGGTQQTFTLSSGLNTGALPVGIYTYDGGATYQDLGGLFASGPVGSPTLALSGSNLPTLIVEIGIDVLGIVTFRVTREATLGSPLTLSISYALLAQEPGDFLTVTDTIGGNKTAYDTRNLYRKIISFGDQNSPNNFIVPHNLGYVPTFGFWTHNGSNSLYIANSRQPGPSYNDPSNTLSLSASVKADANNLYLGSTNQIIYYRIYPEA